MYEAKELKDKFRRGQVCVGTWISFADPTVAELLTGAGYDFFIIDGEHSPMDTQTVQSCVMATKGTKTAPIVRVAWNDAVLIKRVLDLGAAGVLVPMVRNAAEARAAVAACFYPPRGIRGFGPRRPSNYERESAEYIRTANDNIVVWVQIEHVDAVNSIEEIAAVDGLDGMFIGANDLSGSMGLLGQSGHPDVQSAIMKVLEAGRKAGLPVGIGGPAKPHVIENWIEKGMKFVTMGSDQGMLVAAADGAMGELKKMLGRQQTILCDGGQTTRLPATGDFRKPMENKWGKGYVPGR